MKGGLGLGLMIVVGLMGGWGRVGQRGVIGRGWMGVGGAIRGFGVVVLGI